MVLLLMLLPAGRNRLLWLFLQLDAPAESDVTGGACTILKMFNRPPVPTNDDGPFKKSGTMITKKKIGREILWKCNYLMKQYISFLFMVRIRIFTFNK